MPFAAMLAIGLSIAIPALVGTILFFAFRTAKRIQAQHRAQLESEGIELDSGTVWLTIHYSGYSGPGLAVSVGVRKERGFMVLTGKQLAVVPQSRHRPPIGRDDFGHYSVAASSGALTVRGENVPGTRGILEYRVPVSNADAWVDALKSAGMRA